MFFHNAVVTSGVSINVPEGISAAAPEQHRFPFNRRLVMHQETSQGIVTGETSHHSGLICLQGSDGQRRPREIDICKGGGAFDAHRGAVWIRRAQSPPLPLVRPGSLIHPSILVEENATDWPGASVSRSLVVRQGSEGSSRSLRRSQLPGMLSGGTHQRSGTGSHTCCVSAPRPDCFAHGE